VLFLPGAGGAAEFWKPVGDRLPDTWSKRYFAWPGLGNQPHDTDIRSINDLVRLVAADITQPVDLVAQSMGGVVAARIALSQPTLVRRLVLTATSAGVSMDDFGAEDWRADYRRVFPNAAAWITDPTAAEPLAVEDIAAPTLLIWGDADPISPVAVGRHLAARLPKAALHVIPDGDHDLAIEYPDAVAALIRDHLA
jgi:pimeloyl-ACP methyl ester carboxylesterase